MRRKRTHKAVKRPDLSGLKEALRDERVWCVLGIVLASDEAGAHFEVAEGEVLVDVEIQPSEEEITCIVSSPIGGSGVGIFAVPPVGSEVIVALPDGEMMFQPTIVGVMSDTAISGLNDSTLVIVAPSGGTILLHDGSGDGEPLVRKSDFENHNHPTSMGPSGPPIPSSFPLPYTKVVKGK